MKQPSTALSASFSWSWLWVVFVGHAGFSGSWNCLLLLKLQFWVCDCDVLLRMSRCTVIRGHCTRFTSSRVRSDFGDLFTRYQLCASCDNAYFSTQLLCSSNIRCFKTFIYQQRPHNLKDLWTLPVFLEPWSLTMTSAFIQTRVNTQ